MSCRESEFRFGSIRFADLDRKADHPESVNLIALPRRLIRFVGAGPVGPDA